MLKKVLPILFLILCSSTFCFNGWLGIKNEKFTIFYKKENEYAAKTLMQKLNETSAVAERTTGNKIKMVYFVIDDAGHSGQGYADPIISDSIHIFVYSPDTTDIAMCENWYKSVGTHEYTHMLQMKNCSALPGFITSLYGNFYQPNTNLPLWIIEGISTYTESQFSKYSGRLNEGFFDSYILARMKENHPVSLEDISKSSVGFPYGSFYIYGGIFFRFLSEKYGEEKFGEFFNEYGSSITSYTSPVLPFTGIDRVAKKIYGKTFPELWKEWQDFETKRAEKFEQDGEKISDYIGHTSALSIYKGWIYYIRGSENFTSASTSNKKIEIHRRNIATDEEELFFSSTSSILPHLLFKDNSIYFALSDSHTGFGNSSMQSLGADNRIVKIDIDSKNMTEILKDNLRAFGVDSDNNILYSVDKKTSFGSELYAYNENKHSKLKISDSKFLIGEILFSNNKTFVSAKTSESNFGIFEYNIEKNLFTKLADTPYLEGQMSLSENKLFFVSNYNSQFRSYFIDTDTNELFSATNNGFSTFPAYSKENNTLYYIGINTNGHNIYKKELTPVKTEFPEYSQKENEDSEFTDLKYENAGYHENLFSLLKPTDRFLGVSSNNEKSKLFISLSGSDKVSDFPTYDLTLRYDDSKPKDKFNFKFNLQNNLLLPVENSLHLSNKCFKTKFSYPVVLNSKPGIQSLYCGVSFDSEYDLNRKSVAPNISMNIVSPDTFLSLSVETPFEGKSFSDSSKDCFGVISSIKTRKSFKNSFIQGDIASAYNPDSALTDNDTLTNVRGFSDNLNNNDKIFASLNYSYNILKIRKGIWNPNIYFGDLSANIFADTMFERTNFNNRQLSYGVEFSAFSAILFGSVDFTPTVIFSFPENKSWKQSFSFISRF